MTLFEDVYNYALSIVRDYKLDALAKNDYNAFLMYLENILISVIPDFDGCIKPLDYEFIIEKDENGYDKRVPVFKEDLDLKEKSILGKLMVIHWFTSKVQDVTQFQGSLNTREFKKFSESNNLKQKKEYLNVLVERFEQEVTDYQNNNINKLEFFGDIVC